MYIIYNYERMLTARFYYEEFHMSVKTLLPSEPPGFLMSEEFMIVLIPKLALFLRIAEAINYNSNQS